VGADEETDMQVTKFRAANDNGLVPAGRYFARLAEGLREAAAVADVYEEAECQVASRYRWKSASPAPSGRARRTEMALH
jgi:hypothetical protein